MGSLVAWPWAMLTHVSAVYVVYCLATEITNIGQNIFMLINRAGLFNFEVPVGVLWMLSFFVMRVLPVPYITHMYFSTRRLRHQHP